MGLVLVTEQLGHGVLELTDPRADPEVVPAGALSRPGGLAIHPDGTMVVADMGNDRLATYAAGAWSYFGSSGSGHGEFSAPTAVASDAAGRIFVADTGNCRIVRVDDATGGGWESVGTAARPSALDPAPFGFADIRAVTVDGLGRLVVADPGNGRLVRFDVDAFDGGPGRWTEIALPAGAHPTLPFGVTGFAGGLAVTDIGNRWLHLLDADDAVLHTVAAGALRLAIPAYVAELDDGRLAVGDPSANEVRVLAWSGRWRTRLRFRGSDPRLPRHRFEQLGGVSRGQA